MRGAALLLAGLAGLGALRAPGLAAPPAAPSILTVVAGDPPARALVRLSPGFAVVFQFDRAITRVALGDDRLVVFHVDGERGDLTMKPASSSGRTNMVVWAGLLVTLWELVITRDQRTADVIRVVTARLEEPGAARPAPVAPAAPPGGAAAPAATQGGGPAASASISPRTGNAPTSHQAGEGLASPPSGVASSSGSAPAVPQEVAPAFLQASAHGDGVEAVFQAVRVRWGMVVRYRISNRSKDGTRFRIHPERILVRTYNRIVPFALIRQTGTQAPQEVLVPGAAEAGMMTVPGQMTHLRVLFPVFPDGPGLPVLLEAGFTGLHRLAVQPEP